MTRAQAIAQLVRTAALIALETPDPFKANGSSTCYVDRRLVLALRELLPQAGVDYKAARARMVALQRDNEAARLATLPTAQEGTP